MRALLVLALLIPATASARTESFGIGLQAGEPTAVSAQIVLTHVTALDLAVGLGTFDSDHEYFHLDFIFSPFDLGSGSVDLPLYLGLGLALYDTGPAFVDDIGVGVRVPFGIAIDFRRAPFQIFAELGVRLQVVPDVHADLDPTLGFRIFF